MKTPEVHATTQPLLQGLILRPAATVLLHGPNQPQLRQVANWVAQRLTCAEECADGDCASCQRAERGNHPDILLLAPDDKGKIGIEAVHGLQHSLNYRQYESMARRVVIIDQADTLTLPAQNALLKTLEEPPADTTIVITAVSPLKLLDTVRSRCRPLYVPQMASDGVVAPQDSPMTALTEGDVLTRLVTAQKLATSPDTVEELQHYLVAQPMPEGSGALQQRSRLLDAALRVGERVKANVGVRPALEAFVVETA